MREMLECPAALVTMEISIRGLGSGGNRESLNDTLAETSNTV